MRSSLPLILIVLVASCGPDGDRLSEPAREEGCSLDHEQFFVESHSVRIAGADRECNRIRYKEEGGGQLSGLDVIHVDLSLIVEGGQSPTAEPSVAFQVLDMESGEVLGRGARELFASDIEKNSTGFTMASTRVELEPIVRGKNVRIAAEIEIKNMAGETNLATPEGAAYLDPGP